MVQTAAGIDRWFYSHQMVFVRGESAIEVRREQVQAEGPELSSGYPVRSLKCTLDATPGELGSYAAWSIRRGNSAIERR